VAARWLVLLLIAGAVTATGRGSEAPRVSEQKGDPMTTATLARAADMQFEDYDPALVVEAVNELQPLGAEAALDRVEELLAARGPAQPSYGLFWVLRVLFDVPPEQGFPPVRIGRPSVAPPPRSGPLPRFPIVIADDVPLLAVRGYSLAGLAEGVDAHIAYFREHGVIRQAPLSPSRDAAADEFLRQ
jgi:hypothetical protein